MKREIKLERKKIEKKKGYTTEEILNLIDLNQKEIKVSKKTMPIEEKINNENIILTEIKKYVLKNKPKENIF